MQPTIEEIRKEVIDSNRCVMLEDLTEKDCYLGYLNYKNVKALYELLGETAPPDVTWDECIKLVTGVRNVRDAAVRVLSQSITSFLKESCFNFQAITPSLLNDDEPGVEDGIIRSVQFFPQDVGRTVIDWFFLQAEIIQYTCLLYGGITTSWDEYTTELLRKGELWDTLRTAFQDALARIDFRAAWADEIEAGNFLNESEPDA